MRLCVNGDIPGVLTLQADGVTFFESCIFALSCFTLFSRYWYSSAVIYCYFLLFSSKQRFNGASSKVQEISRLIFRI